MYNQPSFARCFSNIDDSGYGTEANPCKCLDGTEQYSTKTRANLTLLLSPTSPPPSAPTGSITASGKLTDNKGNGISGKTIKINRVNANTPPLDASSTFTTTTATDGGFTLTSPVPCSDTATLQAIFDGDTTYTFAVSNPVALTIGGTPVCAVGNYLNSPANVSILSTSFCQNLCSVKDFAADGKKHCGAKFLRVKLDTVVSSNDYNFYYLNPLTSEMWQFFLTNEGDRDSDFHVNVSSYTAGGVTYDCAILLTDENTIALDINKVIWVKAGAKISSTSGNSLEKDIGKGNYNDTCPGDQVPLGDPACQLDSGIFDAVAFPGFTAYDLTKASDSSPRGAIKLFKSKYSSTLDYCERICDGEENKCCSFAKSRVEFNPTKSIICDPNIKAWRSLY
ncbi:hypothetical protein KJ575_00260 [Patescibacteria group bacterium]|nr:hypothetical protein [Patescibacteria group bacterium]MBU4368139.1 hypothetical protein [Patescibacteria group bacterium]